jgi:hypothetical protein
MDIWNVLTREADTSRTHHSIISVTEHAGLACVIDGCDRKLEADHHLLFGCHVPIYYNKPQALDFFAGLKHVVGYDDQSNARSHQFS